MKLHTILLCVHTTGIAVTATASDVIVYPAHGQDKVQQEKDEGDCFVWAKNETGIDPMAQPAAAPTAAPEQHGGAIGGAARGAIVGGIVDGSDSAKTGAAIGAVGGRMRQNSRNRASQQQQQQQAQQAQAINTQNKATFDKAYGVCLQGSGYTVS